MMLLLRLLLLLTVAGPALAAAPVISCPPSRVSGTAPLAVIFDCSGTTDPDTTKPFHDLFYEHTFGDPSAGVWANGANTSLSKNYATGPIAGHVFETCTTVPGPCTYTTSHSVTDGTTVSRTTNTITVANPDTTFSGTNTTCFFNAAVGTGCPAGATQTVSNDYDAAIGACIGSGKRCLFKKGDTFTSSIDITLGAASVMHIGGYGSGAKPIINLCAGCNGTQVTSTSFGDHRMVDLNVQGGGTSASWFLSNLAISNITLLRVDVSATAAEAIQLFGGCTGCAIQDSTFQTNTAAALVYGDFFSSAILGSTIGPTSAGGQHSLRVSKGQKLVVSYNTITTSQVSKEVFAFRAHDHVTNADDSFFSVVSYNNILEGPTGSYLFQTSNGGGTDVRIYDLIVEGNWFEGTVVVGSGFDCSNGIRHIGTRTTIRNNMFKLYECGDSFRAVDILREGGADPVPTDNVVVNNTLYSTTPKIGVGTKLQANATNTIVKNNLCRVPSGTAGTTCLDNAGSGTVASNNSSDAQTTGTDPLFDGPLTTPIGFRISTSSYGANGGTRLYPSSIDDFFHCDDTTVNERMGAFVPRVRATCRGAAGP